MSSTQHSQYSRKSPLTKPIIVSRLFPLTIHWFDQVQDRRLRTLSVRTARVPAPHNRSQHVQANTNTRFYTVCSPDDGHNDARNMLR